MQGQRHQNALPLDAVTQWSTFRLAQKFPDHNSWKLWTPSSIKVEQLSVSMVWHAKLP